MWLPNHWLHNFMGGFCHDIFISKPSIDFVCCECPKAKLLRIAEAIVGSKKLEVYREISKWHGYFSHTVLM